MSWATEHGYVRTVHNGAEEYEHRVVAEGMLGRPLAAGEVVHHKNEDKTDNRPENLDVLTRSEHALRHAPVQVTDGEIEQLLLLGITGKELAKRRIWQHRVQGVKRVMVATGRGPLLERARIAFGAPRPFRNSDRCGRGHELTTESTYVDPTGRRSCRICRRAWKARNRRRLS